MPESSDERALASALVARDDAELTALLLARGIAPSASWEDAFDAATALLEESAVERALLRAPRFVLVALGEAVTEATALPDRARDWAWRRGLVDDAGALFGGVAQRIRDLADREPAAFEARTAADPSPATEDERHAAEERAFSSVSALTDLLVAASDIPLLRTGAGQVSAVDRRRLVDAGAVADAEELEDLVASAAEAGLVRGVEREWVVTVDGLAWLEKGTADRWERIVRAFPGALGEGLVTDDGGFAPPSRWPDAFPLDPAWPDRASRTWRVALRWGLYAPSGAEPDWTTALRRTGTPATAAFAELLPAEIDRVYLQADLSAIAPGPLAPAIELRLRRMAVRESRAQASTYRFTPASVASAVALGETAASLRAFLGGISLTGIPQPLDYLVEQESARHGLVRVGVDPASGRTRIESADRELLAAIAVDQALRPVGLVPDGDALASRVGRDAVYWTLADARYPVVAVDAAGAAERPVRREPPAASRPATPDYGRLVAVLRAAQDDGSDAAWLQRELDRAARERQTMTVVVAMPGGATREFLLEVTGLGGGRLRGRDRSADVERTLPVASIVSARPAEDATA
ncbi:helicase-associated domain-containing protein [Microbacterium sp. X-17]|uniref:helicase-associated domain-containing protein n=1 Tax=Microbacterium sp. X-17 TaxID=3144404 RepID=UPI0031F5079A